MTFLRIDPSRVFEIQGQISELKSKLLIAAGATNNQQVVAGVANKKLRYMGHRIQSNGAANASVNLKDGSGGTIYFIFNAPTNAQPPDDLPIKESGYWSTSSGNGIFVDIGSAIGALITVYYVEI